MTLSQAKAAFIKHCAKLARVDYDFILGYLNSCTEKTFEEKFFKGLMKIAGVEI